MEVDNGAAMQASKVFDGTENFEESALWNLGSKRIALEQYNWPTQKVEDGLKGRYYITD